MQHDNEFDERFIDWFAGCYMGEAANMPPEQRRQIEMAFYAGGSSGMTIRPLVVAKAVESHVERIKQGK